MKKQKFDKYPWPLGLNVRILIKGEIMLAFALCLLLLSCQVSDSQGIHNTEGVSENPCNTAEGVSSGESNKLAKLAETAEVFSGLEFPSNGKTSSDVRFRFKDNNLMPMYPGTYIWRVKLRQHSGYYTTFFWGPDGDFTGTNYFGCHPYPDGEPKQSSRSHKWELSIDGQDFVKDVNNHNTSVNYDEWHIQAFRVVDDGKNKVHEFYWNLPDTTKVIRSSLSRSYGNSASSSSALTFGDAPWSLGNERLSGILRGIQLYTSYLSLPDLIKEINNPLSSKMGQDKIWYLNMNPSPNDIEDKSGKNHHPQWVSSAKAGAWSEKTSGLASVPRGNSSGNNCNSEF